jgi:hypothetical protein
VVADVSMVSMAVTSASSWNDIPEVLNLHKTVDCCMIKCVLLIKCVSGSISCFGPSSVLVGSVALAS